MQYAVGLEKQMRDSECTSSNKLALACPTCSFVQCSLVTRYRVTT